MKCVPDRQGLRFFAGIAAIVAFIGALGVAMAAVEDLRWWAWAGEMREIAGVSFDAMISQKSDKMILVEDRLYRCEQSGNEDCAWLRQEAERLRREIRDLETRREHYSG